ASATPRAPAAPSRGAPRTASVVIASTSWSTVVMRSTRTWCGNAVWSRASIYPSRHASTSGVSIPLKIGGRAGCGQRAPAGSAAPAVGAAGVGGPRVPVAPVAGDDDGGPGVPVGVERGQRGPVRAVDLPVAVVVGGAVGVLPPAGFRH